MIDAARGKNIRFGTDIITFFNTTYWGLPGGLAYPDWVRAFTENPKHYFDAIFDGVHQAGLSGIEFAPEPGDWINALKAYGSVEELRRALDTRGLVTSSSYAPRVLIGDALKDSAFQARADLYVEKQSKFLVDMGADLIVMGNVQRSRFGNEGPDNTATPEDFDKPVPLETHERFADQVNRLGAVAGRYGVRLAIHTDAYSVCSRNEDIATVMELTDPNLVFLCVDAGQMGTDNADPVAALRSHLERVPLMHWKDCAGHLPGHLVRGTQKERHTIQMTYFRVLGSGKVNWKEWMEILRDGEWQGWAIEEIDDSPDPVGELRQGMEYFQRELSSIYM